MIELDILAQPHEQNVQSESDLIDRARAGDREAFRIFVERYQEEIATLVAGMLGRSDDVDDVVQEAFIALYRSLDTFRGDASPVTYLKRIAINRSLDQLRRRRRRLARFLSRDDSERNIPEPASAAGDPLEAGEMELLVQKGIDALPAKQRAVVVLRLIDGCSTEETATTLGIAYGTVLSRLSRAYETLRGTLAPYLSDRPLDDPRFSEREITEES